MTNLDSLLLWHLSLAKLGIQQQKGPIDMAFVDFGIERRTNLNSSLL